MKSFYFLFVCLVCFSTSLFAQEDVLRYPIPEGGQPFDYKYPKASKVHCKMHNYFEIIREWDKYYDYSEDSLNLTIRQPEGKQYIRYNINKTMASYSNPFYNWNDTYTYTDDGKIKSSNIIFEGKSWIAAMNEPCLPKRIYGYCMAAADFHILTCLRGQTCPFRRKFHYGKKI